MGPWFGAERVHPSAEVWKRRCGLASIATTDARSPSAHALLVASHAQAPNATSFSAAAARRRAAESPQIRRVSASEAAELAALAAPGAPQPDKKVFGAALGEAVRAAATLLASPEDGDDDEREEDEDDEYDHPAGAAGASDDEDEEGCERQ